MSQRRRSREAAFQVLFSRHFTGLDRIEATQRHGAVASEAALAQDDFSQRLLTVEEANADAITEALEASLHKWSIERLPPVDYALLRLAATEILYFEDIPAKATINEYIELAKRYGDDDSGKFLNAVLDRVLRRDAPEKVPEGKGRRKKDEG
jgi:N utilization substance protein B